jgi:GT2 family glycosyltransferase
LLFLNPDTIVPPSQIQRLSKFLDMHPDIGILGPKILYPDGSLQLTCGQVPSLKWSAFEALRLPGISPRLFGDYQYILWPHDVTREVGWVSGACLMIRKELFIILRGFDENFLFYAEDTDICVRAGWQGFKVVYWPEVYIIHFGGQSSKKLRAQSLIMGYCSKLYYFHKHHGGMQCASLRFIFIFSSLLTVIPAFIAALLKQNSECVDIARAHLVAAVKLLWLQIPRTEYNEGSSCYKLP